MTKTEQHRAHVLARVHAGILTALTAAELLGLSVREYIRAISKRYATATVTAKRKMLDEFCATTGYHRKSAIRALGKSHPPRRSQRRRRGRPQT